jgi:phage terminase small subunit
VLVARKELFVAEYIGDLNATQAAIRAGYSPKTAKQQAQRLMQEPAIKAAIAKKQKKVFVNAELTATRTLEAIRRPLVADVRKLFDSNGNLRPITSLGDDEAALIAGFEVIVKNAEAGDGHTDKVHKIKIVDRARYVEMAAKHFKLLTDVQQQTGAVKMVIEWA